MKTRKKLPATRGRFKLQGNVLVPGYIAKDCGLAKPAVEKLGAVMNASVLSLINLQTCGSCRRCLVE